MQYNISFSDKNDDLIKSSDLILFHKVHINCILTLFDNHRKIQFESFPNIINNTKYKCMDYIKINQKFKFGIKYYIENCESKIIYFFNNNLLKHEILYLFNDKFNSLLIDKNYNNLIALINKTNSEERNSLNLKKMFIRKPIYSSKSDISLLKNKWYFKNIYNNYFCFCRGNCHYKNIDNQCKYLFYLYIIDENKYLYNKTDYLFSDFYLISKSSDDTYPLFEEMVKQNLSVHYMDEKKEIYDKYCFNNKYCLKIIPVVNGNIDIDGDFLEKYLDIILRLKAVIAGESFYSPEKIFYNIDYITYINLGHGIKYFKQKAYLDYVSFKSFNKIILPPSKKIITIAKNYGWKDKNIITNCLPRWDKYRLKSELKSNKSIFVMFTWRNLTNKDYNMSNYYLKNIINLINDLKLNNELINKNITLYFTLHSIFSHYKAQIKKHKNINYIEHRQVSNCLKESSLLITDFSSIIFDMIYQRKPYIMFIPDANDPNIRESYDSGYYEIIESLKNDSLFFKNKFINLKEAINKIIFYINNNFKLEKDLLKFYDSFELNCTNNTKNLINYLINN